MTDTVEMTVVERRQSGLEMLLVALDRYVALLEAFEREPFDNDAAWRAICDFHVAFDFALDQTAAWLEVRDCKGTA